ncbi:MAG: protein YgfX [Gammaproteobacteria bacterium]
MFDQQGLQVADADKGAGYGNPYESALSFVYRPLHGVLWLAVCCTLGACLAVHIALLAPALKLLCYLLLSVCLGQSVRRFIALRRRPRLILHLSRTDEWSLYKGTQKTTLRLLSDCLVHPQWVILHFRDQYHQRHDFILTPRNTDPDQLRLLRVRLRHPQ